MLIVSDVPISVVKVIACGSSVFELKVSCPPDILISLLGAASISMPPADEIIEIADGASLEQIKSATEGNLVI